MTIRNIINTINNNINTIWKAYLLISCSLKESCLFLIFDAFVLTLLG